VEGKRISWPHPDPLSEGEGTCVGRSIPRAVAGYPVRSVTFDFDGPQVRLLMIKRLEDYVDAEALLRDPDAPEPPYWAHVWPGSRALAQRMSQVACAGRRVIDIGCGLGLAGIVAALRGAAVTLFDAAPEGVQFAGANAALNGCCVGVVQTDIRRPGIRGLFDYCLAADVTYDPALQSAVASFVAAHLAPAGRAWCAESVRTLDQGFRYACEAHGLRVNECEGSEFDENREIPVRLTEVCWR
jgi:predicted nicotinamide N-methyase